MTLTLLWLPATLLLFLAATRLYQRTRWLLCNPVVITIALLVAILYHWQIPYTSYLQGGHYIDWLLEPSVVALGYPLYQQRRNIQQDGLRLISCCSIATLIAISSMALLAKLFSLSKLSAISGTAKAITTAIAVVVSEQQGGIPALTAVVVIFAGMLGSLVAIPLFKRIGIHSAKAQGVAMGAASHALGTARIREEGEIQAAYSALSLVLCAILTALLLPVLLPCLLEWLHY